MTNIASQLDQARTQLTAPGAPFELTDIESDNFCYKAYKNAPATLPQLIEASRQSGDKTFLVYEGENWSFEQFFQHVDALSYTLINTFNIAKGDRVVIAMRNYPEWMTAFIAIVSIGAIAVPLNSWGTATELSYGLADADAQLVFCDQARYDALQPELAKGTAQAIIVRPEISSPPPKTTFYGQLIDDALHKPQPDVSIEPDDPALILYTSGTTGVPKGALSTHRSITQAIFNFNFGAACAAITSPEIIKSMSASGFEPSSLLALPLFHVSGCHSVLLLNLHTARKIVIMHKWDAKKALQLIKQERITTFSGVPTMARQLLDSPHYDETDTSSLFGIGGGGSVSPLQLIELIYKKKPNAFAGTGYGLTETNAAGSSITGSAFRYKPASVGTLSPIVEIQIRNEQGDELTQGQIGIIWLKGITLLQGYWRNPQATKTSLQDGWFDTGDIGYVDEEGFLFLVDRAKDMIIRGGENIYAAEIEACIDKHSSVEDVAAFGIPHDLLGETVVVAVQPRKDCTLDEANIRNHVAQYLATFKVPAHVWIHTEILPRNASGKLLKNDLRETFLKRLKS